MLNTSQKIINAHSKLFQSRMTVNKNFLDLRKASQSENDKVSVMNGRLCSTIFKVRPFGSLILTSGLNIF